MWNLKRKLGRVNPSLCILSLLSVVCIPTKMYAAVQSEEAARVTEVVLAAAARNAGGLPLFDPKAGLLNLVKAPFN